MPTALVLALTYIGMGSALALVMYYWACEVLEHMAKCCADAKIKLQ